MKTYLKLANTLIILVSILLPGLVKAANCIELYENTNFQGTKWSFCPGQTNDYSWNDRASSLVVPAGFILQAFQHSGYAGKSKYFEGAVAWVGDDFNDIISSFKSFSSSNCLKAYEDTNYKGQMWPFCPANAASPPVFADWNDKITSLRVPSGFSAKLCVDLTHTTNGTPAGKTFCRQYFKDTNYVGSTLNDKFSFIQRLAFNRNEFVMAMISDPQYYYCDSHECKSGPGSSMVANNWHSNSIQALSTTTPSFAGVVVNGDITNTEEKSEWQNFKNDYEAKLLNLYVGLGNHDYDNYYDKWCAGYTWSTYDAKSKYYCTRRILEYMNEHINSIPYVNYDMARDSWNRVGSFGYSWDVGNYRFFQLHNYPSWTVGFSSYISSRVGSERFAVTKSLEWLAARLAETPSTMRVVINMHAILSQSFNATGGIHDGSGSESDRSTNTAADYQRFLAILDRHPRVAAVFAGHLHTRIGYHSDLTTPAGKKVPVFFTGSAETNRYLKVTYRSNSMTVEPINSSYGLVSNWGEAQTFDFAN